MTQAEKTLQDRRQIAENSNHLVVAYDKNRFGVSVTKPTKITINKRPGVFQKRSDRYGLLTLKHLKDSSDNMNSAHKSLKLSTTLTILAVGGAAVAALKLKSALGEGNIIETTFTFLKNTIDTLTTTLQGVGNIFNLSGGDLSSVSDIRLPSESDRATGTYDGSNASSGKITEQGLQMLRNKEGFRSNAYKDQKGVWTIGYGHTGNVRPGDTITKDAAEVLLKNDVTKFENVVKKSVKVPISQNMFDALVVFCYNIGPGAFASSTLLKRLNKGDYKGAQQQFSVWNKIKDEKTGKYIVSKGLAKRRAEEAALFGKDIQEGNMYVPESNAYSTYDSRGYDEFKSSGSVYNQKRQLSYASGMSFGGYTLKSRGVKVTDYMGEYLKQVRGTGVITSGSEINKYHYWKSGGGYSSRHVLGNKIDVRTNDTRNAYELARRVIPFMEHPATIMINFEYISSSRFNETLNIIRQQRPDLYARIGKDLKVVNTQPKNSSGVGHLDIEIDPRRMQRQYVQSPPVIDNYTQSNKNAIKAEQNNKQIEDQKVNKSKSTKQQPKSRSSNLLIKDNSSNVSTNIMFTPGHDNFIQTYHTTRQAEQKNLTMSF